MVERISKWVAAKAPKREELAQSRWLRPFGTRVLNSEFWRFTRRSVPRGVAVGLFVGVFLLIPGVQIVGSALLSIPFRANIPVAAAMTFLTNPLTTPFLIAAAIPVGNRLGFHADASTVDQSMIFIGGSIGDEGSYPFPEQVRNAKVIRL